MKLKLELDVAVTVKATIREGMLAVELSMGVPYGTTGRICTTSLPIDDAGCLESIRAAMENSISDVMPVLVAKAQANAQEAMRVAMSKGEE